MSEPFSSPSALAEALLAARRNRTRLPLTLAPPPSFADAYATQRLVTDALGKTVSAWKIGLTPEGTVFVGPMYSLNDHGFRAAPQGFIAAEVEYAVRLNADLPQRPITRAEALALIDDVVLGFEFIETRFVEIPDLLLHTADNVANGGYTVGPRLDRSALDCPARTIRITLNGIVLFEGEARHPNGDALAPLMAYAKASADPALRDHLGGIRKGHLVTLGSLCGGVAIPSPGQLVAEMLDIGRFDLSISR